MENCGKLARALYTNNVDSKHELYFRKGEILTVIEFDFEGQAGWWLCTLGGDRGLCPGNYLELLEDKYSLPVKPNGANIAQTRDLDALDLYDVPRSHQEVLASQNASSDPLELYDFPRNETPVYCQPAVVRGKQHGSEGSFLSSSTGSSNRVSSASSSSSGQSSASLDGPGRAGNQYRLRNQFPSNIYANSQFHGQESQDFRSRSNTGSSFTSNQAPSYQNSMKSSFEKPDEDPLADYDVPRSAVKSYGSRPQSSLSMSGSEFISLGSGDSKDSLDMYDVPRNLKNCVSRFETKYDQVPHRNSQSSLITQSQNNLKRASVCSTSSNGSSNNIQQRFGVVLRSAGGNLKKSDSVSSSSNFKAEPSEIYDVPPSTSSRNGSLKSWAGSTSISLDQDPNQSVYDLPAEFSRQVSLCGSTETLSCHDGFRDSFSDRGSVRLGQQAASQLHLENGLAPVEVKILPLCPKAAVSVCEKLRQEVITSIHSILGFVRPKWRVKDNLREIMPELRFSCVRLNLAIKDLADFCSRSLSNAKKLGLDSLVLRLQRLLNPLANGSHIIQKDVDELEAYLWSVDRLSVPISETAPSSDALDQLVLCARSLQHDVTEIANFIALNSTALFLDDDPATTTTSRTSIEPMSQPIPPPVDDDQDDYDYVTLASMAEANQIRSISGPPLSNANPAPVSNLDSKDQHLLEFYSAQIATIAPLLSQSISSFISSVHHNDPPKVFNGHLKYVILLAYKMLFAGDTVHRNIVNPDIKLDVESKSDELHTAVVALHEASKIATRDFPKILPMQNIVDHVWQATAAATELKKVIFNACV